MPDERSIPNTTASDTLDLSKVGIQVGPVMTVGQVLAHYFKGHPSYRPLPNGQQPRPVHPPDMETLNPFSIEDLYHQLSGMMERAKADSGDGEEGGPMRDGQQGDKDEGKGPVFFGPELPPHHPRNRAGRA
ncbi:hypothetical protein CAC42_3637 [Sphaceloma murrayae]|uniref:Uncharacterized protein n=1 Tax=Sphaceloma murrayae TaxID=2082308 RepID=A0A2K1QPN7_9PEZI|nr:hypothetical protein CAC42_3637 [Sphaceloma murrayae]